MIEKLCKNCDNRICKDMYSTMQKEYIKMCLDSNRRMFVSHKEQVEKRNDMKMKFKEYENETD